MIQAYEKMTAKVEVMQKHLDRYDTSKRFKNVLCMNNNLDYPVVSLLPNGGSK